MSLAPGTRLGHCDVIALLGEGGMRQVWQATETQFNRQRCRGGPPAAATAVTRPV